MRSSIQFQCRRCQFLETQVSQKNNQIEQQKGYQQLLELKLKREEEIEFSDEIRRLKRSINDQEVNEIKINRYTEDLTEQLKYIEEKLMKEQERSNNYQQENIDLKRSILDIERKSIERPKQKEKFIKAVVDLIKSCLPNEKYKDKEIELKQCWRWLKLILEDYIRIKQCNEQRPQ